MKRILSWLLALAVAAAPFDSLALRGVTSSGSTTAASIATAESGEDSLTAFATGGQTSATALSATVVNHRVTTVVTAGDSVKLPAATVGARHYVRNDGAAAMQVFGQATETINGVASATGISQGVGMGVWYECTTAGAWTTSPVSTITATTQFLTPIGSTTIPGYGFSGSAGGNASGLYFVSSGNQVILTSNGTSLTSWTAGETRWGSGQAIGWSSNVGPSVAVNDTIMVRDAANTWALKNGTNAQTARIYGTTTGPKYLSLSHDGTNGVIDTAASSGLVSIAPTNATSVTLGKKITSYNGVTAVGNGVPVIVGAGRITASNAANANINTYATPAADGSYEISANVLVTTATTHAFTFTVAYTDEGNTARTVTMTFGLVAGGVTTTSIANANGAVPYMGVPLHIRTKASTNIVCATTGTFTTVTYNAECIVRQLN
jgi:hypothetical protein